MTVYIIECGFYSDKYILGVYSSEDEAKGICEIFNKIRSSNYGREEHYARYYSYEVDSPRFSWEGTKPYWIHVNGKEVDDAVCLDDLDSYDYRHYDAEEPENYKINSYSNEFFVMATDKDHALKTASDMYAEYKYRMEVGE